MRALACLLLTSALCGTSFANGRPASVRSVSFQPAHPQRVVAGATFGLLVSDDGGATWRWMCEQAVGYGGTYDPDYAYAASGAVFATTFDGLRVNRDGCSFDATTLGNTFVSQVELPATATVLASAADPADVAIHRSVDDGLTFPASASPGLVDDWWQSLRVAPSDAQRVYLSGYRIVDGVRETLLFTSDDGGATFSPMATTGLMLSDGSVVSIVGVSAGAPTTVYALVTFEPGAFTDGIYVSTDAGGSWTRIFSGLQPLTFLVRSSGQLVVAGPTLTKASGDGGTTWTDVTAPSAITNLVERPDGVVWASTQNYGPAGYAIMASTDLVTWTGVLRLQDLAGPVACPAGTTQHDTCAPLWCALRMQLGITADPTGCDSLDGAIDGIPDAPLAPSDAPIQMKPAAGCCDASGSAPGSFAVAMLAAVALRRRRPRLT